jgi:uncharacterized membrane protein YbhN (UPF0104 family)
MSLAPQLREAWHLFAAATPSALFTSVVFYLAGALAIGFRLALAARRSGVTVSPLRAAAIAMSSVFASHVTFGAAAGEATKVAWLLRRGSLRNSLRTIFIDRLADGIAIAGLALIALFDGVRGLASCATVGLGLVALRRVRPFLRDAVAALPAALLAWALDLLRVLFVARAVNLTLDLRAIASLAIAALLGGQAPTPAGLGAVEAAMVAAGAALGLPIDRLVAAVAADRCLTLVFGTTLGAAASAALSAQERRTA